jgi:hypothetical protein
MFTLHVFLFLEFNESVSPRLVSLVISDNSNLLNRAVLLKLTEKKNEKGWSLKPKEKEKQTKAQYRFKRLSVIS